MIININLGEGRSEPIKINPFRESKTGLGKDAENVEKARKKLKLEQAKLKVFRENETQMLRSFRDSKKQEALSKRLRGWVRKCQSICQQMDERSGRTPPYYWYWKVIQPDSANSDEEAEEVSIVSVHT